MGAAGDIIESSKFATCVLGEEGMGVSQGSEETTTRIVFISSPFSEPRGTKWLIRRRLYERLNSPPYKPWIYEIEGKREEKENSKAPDRIIREAIEGSDVVVCFLKQRLGSWMQTDFASGPFHGTDDEIFWARQSNKPVLLYRIGDAAQPLLRGFWELFEDSRILPHVVRNLTNEEDLLEAVPSDLNECWVRSSRLFLPASVVDDATGLPEIPDLLALEKIRESLLAARQRDLYSAEQVAATVPLIEEPRLPRNVKLKYAALLADCGSVWANRACYDRAITAEHLSIRYYLEAGDWQSMFTQALSLSGILNMASQPRAQFVYRYSTRTIFHMPELHHLMAACHDNKASILMTSGHWVAAHAHMAQARKELDEESPYTLSKYAISMAAARPGKLSEANTILFDEALSIARRKNRDLGYTLKWAAILALQQKERSKARAFIDEGVQECLRFGNRHTLADICAAESYYQLTEV
jgi:Domain of unknown function (DUF4062)